VRASLNAKRLELRTSNLSKAEQLLGRDVGPEKEIVDVQRFGDRLDLLVHHPDQAMQSVESQLKSAQLEF